MSLKTKQTIASAFLFGTIGILVLVFVVELVLFFRWWFIVPALFCGGIVWSVVVLSKEE